METMDHDANAPARDSEPITMLLRRNQRGCCGVAPGALPSAENSFGCGGWRGEGVFRSDLYIIKMWFGNWDAGNTATKWFRICIHTCVYIYIYM